jgi:hypothetical protein
MVRTLVMSLTAVALSAGPVLAQAPPAGGCQALMDQIVAATNNRLDYSADRARDKLVEAARLLKENKQVECAIKVEEAANDIQLTLKK